MKWVTIFLAVIVTIFSQYFVYGIPKCCNNGDQMESINSTWTCRLNSNKRLQSIFEIENFITGNINGTCVETVFRNQTSEFFLDKDKNISKKKKVKLDFFPKCCHLGKSYNQKLHSCVQMENPTAIEKFIPKDSFISIGLPWCKIISDVEVPSLDFFSFPSRFIYLSKEKRNISEGNFCVDSTLDSQFIVRICEMDYQICDHVRCIHKCCSDGQSLVNGSKCRDTFRYGVDLHSTKHIEDPDSKFAIIHGIQRPLGLLREDILFNVTKNGEFLAYIPSEDSFAHYGVETDIYCIEYAYEKLPVNRSLNNYAIFVFFGKIAQAIQPIETKISVTRWVKFVSCIFLLLTIMVYAILPKLRNPFGKILLSYCVALLILFFLLTITHFFPQDISKDVCKFAGFSLIFFNFSSFTWMHVICIDIWYSFGSPRTISGSLQRNERKKLLLYSMYAWGFPMVWVLLILFFNQTELLPKSIHPFVGEQECYFENYDNRKGNYAFSLFITLPMILQQIVNIVLFIRTVRHCIKVKSEIRRMDDNNRSRNDYQAGKEKLYLVLKLGVVMGMLFLFETISSIRKMNVNPITEHIEIVWDTINCLQGLFIFIIFICKKKVYINLCEKWNKVRGQSPASIITPGSMQSTCTNEEILSLEEKTWTSTKD